MLLMCWGEPAGAGCLYSVIWHAAVRFVFALFGVISERCSSLTRARVKIAALLLAGSTLRCPRYWLVSIGCCKAALASCVGQVLLSWRRRF